MKKHAIAVLGIQHRLKRRGCLFRVPKRIACAGAGTRGVRRCLNKSMRRVASLVVLMRRTGLSGGGCRACVFCCRSASLVVAWRFSLAIMCAVSTAACALAPLASVRDLVNLLTPLTDNETTRLIHRYVGPAIGGNMGRDRPSHREHRRSRDHRRYHGCEEGFPAASSGSREQHVSGLNRRNDKVVLSDRHAKFQSVYAATAVPTSATP